MTYTEQLESESDQVRLDLAESLNELRARISPGQVVDQLVEYARDGSGAEFVRNLKQQAVNNPIPVVLIGAGVAWLMMSGADSGQSSGSATRLTERAAGAFRDAGQSISDAGERARAGASSVADTAAQLRERVGDMAASTYDAATGAFTTASERTSNTSAAAADSAKNFGRGAVETSKTLVGFCREQPLVLAGVGLALGAVLGAILPSTETEGRLMGEASDTMKTTVKDAAGDALDKAVAIGEHALDAGKNEAREQGLTQTPNVAAAGAEVADVPAGDAQPVASQSTVPEHFHEGVDANPNG
jgi:ElaB/YqjD/DUF883 family membrane-anchored ribosome-binding protein